MPRGVRAAALAGGVAAIIGSTGPPGAAHEAAPPALPATVHGVPRDGGLPLTDGLAVGRVSVAIVNRTDVFLVSAADGAYSRVRLPGYDAALYDAGVPGVALSPDGSRLAYAWHARRASPRPASGARVVDLVSGSVTSYPGFGELAWNFQWSPNGRFVAFDHVDARGGFRQGWVRSDPEHRTSRIDTTARTRVEVGAPGSTVPADARTLAVGPQGWTYRLVDDRLVAWDGPRRVHSVTVSGWDSARVSPNGRWLYGGGVVTEATRDRGFGSVVMLKGDFLDDGGTLETLGWVDDNQVVALARRPSGPTGLAADADLVRLEFVKAPDAAARDFPRIPRLRVIPVSTVTGGAPGTAFSFATDLAALPVRDVPVPPFTREDASGHQVPPAAPDPVAEDTGVPLQVVLIALASLAGLAVVLLLAQGRRPPARP